MLARRPALFAVSLSLTALLSACGGGDNDSAAAPSPSASPTPEATQEPTQEPTLEPAPVPTQERASDRVSFTMPNLVGTDLQTAQDKVQEFGIFYSISHDLLGSRSQVIDSNWIVCDQTPRAGAKVQGRAEDWEGKIDFGVVKREERCP